MKTVSQWHDIDQYHAKCVCETCTCHKHKCPHSKVNFVCDIDLITSWINFFLSK